MNAVTAQKKIIDSYFKSLKEIGYLNCKSTSQILFATLLLDTLDTFKEFVTDEYKFDVNRILQKLDHCNCTITYDKPCPCHTNSDKSAYDFVVKRLPAYYLGDKVSVCCAIQGDDDFYVAGDSYDGCYWDMPKALFVGAVLRVTADNVPVETSWGEDNFCVASHSENEYIETDTGGEELYDNDAVIGLSHSIIFQKGKLYRIKAFVPYLMNETEGAILYEEVQ